MVDKMKVDHGTGKADGAGEGLHVVVIPLPAQGHITPFLQLARKLVGYGFRITFVNTMQSHERLMKARSKDTEPENGIEFVPVSDGLPDHSQLRDLSAFCRALLDLGPAFEELFVKLQRKSPITCIIRDLRFSAIHYVAKKLDIPVVAFFTASAIANQCFFHLPTFLSRGILPIPLPPAHATPSLDSMALTLAPPRSDEEAAARRAPVTCLSGGSPTMMVEDLPTPLLSHDIDNFWYRLYLMQNPLLPECECVLYNTFHDLEGDILDAMTAMNSNILALGPLVLDSTTDADGVEEVTVAGAGSALWEEDPLSLSWLDARSPNSVLFVSFGSIATMSVEQMQEFARGLEMSGHAFVWVIRSDLIDNMMCEDKEFERIFSEFVTRTRDRALMVPWVPQTAVLSHPSVGAFLTHCGWNSVVESVTSGVPMLGWPRFADQKPNCHYITQVWKIGLTFQSEVRGESAVVPKEEVARKVMQIMAAAGTDVEVDKIRSNSRNFQMASRKAVANGGSSHKNLAALADLIQKRAKQIPLQES